MKQAFIAHRFSDQSQALIVQVETILDEYRAQGYTLTLRQLYYQLVARDLLPDGWEDKATGSKNNIRSYKRMGDLVSNARLAGLLDWEMIEDRGRELVIPNFWRGPGQIVRAAAQQFRIDMWENQTNHVEVMVEKDALSGVLGPVCNRLGIGFTANKGYSSSSAMYEAGQRMAMQVGNGKDIHLFYFGDHDPSGIDMTDDITKRLDLFMLNEPINVKRLALNMDQVEKWNPPENPAKETDSRFNAYVVKYGDKSWELDAVKPEDLANLVERNVKKLIDDDAWSEAQEKQQEMRAKLLDFADSYKED